MRFHPFTVVGVDSDGALAARVSYSHAEPSACFQFSTHDYDLAVDLLGAGLVKINPVEPLGNDDWNGIQKRAAASRKGMWGGPPTVIEQD